MVILKLDSVLQLLLLISESTRNLVNQLRHLSFASNKIYVPAI